MITDITRYTSVHQEDRLPGVAPVTLPACEPVTVQDILAYEKIKNLSTKANVIRLKLVSGRELVEGYISRYLVIRTLDQTWDKQSNSFELRYPPVLKVLGVYLTDYLSNEVQVDTSVYDVITNDNTTEVRLKDDQIWPVTSSRSYECVRIRTINGYVTPCTSDAATDTLSFISEHPYQEGDMVELSCSGGSLPAGLIESKRYFLKNVNANTTQLATTLGGSIVDIQGDIAANAQMFIGRVPSDLVRAICVAAVADYFKEEYADNKERIGITEDSIPGVVKDLCRRYKRYRL